MRFFEWNESYSVNVKEIDAQHKKLFRMISDFYDSVKEDNKKAMALLLDSLTGYIMYHFEMEERYLEKCGYPDLESHKREHISFVEKVLDVNERFEAGRLVLSFEITIFLKNWLVHHVMHSDKKYSECLNKINKRVTS